MAVVPKYTPNKPKDAGLEARQKLGWWHAYRFLILRRISQLSIILMFLSGPMWNVWILKGNYSSSMLFDTVPLTDPLITAESLATGYLLQRGFAENLGFANRLKFPVNYAMSF